MQAQLVRHANLPGPYTPVTTATGTLTGSVATDGLYGGTPVGYSSYSGQGNAKPFGSVVGGTTFLAISSTTNAAVLNVTNGTLVLTTLRGGNQLFVNYSGSITSNKHGIESWSFVGTVASGTGRFAGATGTFSGVGTANRSGMGTFTLKYTVGFSPAV